MDEITELKRIWESTEKRLADIAGDQEREYSVYQPDKKKVGTLMIPVNYDSEDILQALIEVGYLRSDGDYSNVCEGTDNKMDIDETIGEDTAVCLSLKTNEEIEDFDQFMQDALDIERVQYLSGRDGWITKEYTVVLGTGGPHVEFTTNYSINVYWGGKSQEFTTYNDNARSTIDRVEDYLNEIYQEY
jgi:hypothetical protein